MFRNLTIYLNSTIFLLSSMSFMYFCYFSLISLSTYISLQEECIKVSYLNAKWQYAEGHMDTFPSFFYFTSSILLYQGCKSSMASTETNAETGWWKTTIGLITTLTFSSLGSLSFGNLKKYLTGQQQQLLFLFSTGWNLKILMLTCIAPNVKLKYWDRNN